MCVLDYMIRIPSYLIDIQRHTYINAVVITRSKSLILLHDCIATTLGYGIYKIDFSNFGPIYIVFVDISHYDTQILVASFEIGQMKIISCF